MSTGQTQQRRRTNNLGMHGNQFVIRRTSGNKVRQEKAYILIFNKKKGQKKVGPGETCLAKRHSNKTEGVLGGDQSE